VSVADAQREPGPDWQAVRRDWPRIGGITLLAGAVGVAYAFLAPAWYQSQLALVPQASSKSGLAALTADLPINLDIGGGDSASADRIQAVLKSRTVTDAVIEKFQLQQRYEEAHLENARKVLWLHCSTKLDKKPGVVTLTCEDRDPQMAQAITAYFAEVGNTVFRRISKSSAAEERRFLETRWEQSKKDVVTAAMNLRDFEEKHKLVDLGEQSKAMVSAMASLKADLLAKQIQLSYLTQFSSSDEATATQLRREISILQAKLDSMMDEGGLESASAKEGESDAGSDTDVSVPAPRPRPVRKGKDKKASTGFFPVAMKVPQLKFELEGLYREKKIQETLFQLLTQRYELARISEARDTSAFEVLDLPVVSDHRSRPKRAPIVAGALFVGLLLGLSVSVARSWRRV
jgi:uncharacterized protein involved in exopolysaccharide biosynthesis